MSIRSVISDGLMSMATRLGTSDDKAQTGSYVPKYLSNRDIEGAFRSSWIVKKTVKIPALDATRRWRQWQGTNADSIAAVENLPRIQLRKKLYSMLWQARLHGGAAVLIGTDVPVEGMKDPLDPDMENLEYLTVLPRTKLAAGPIEDDITSALFGDPRYYSITSAGAHIYIHPSRLVKHVGEELPSWGSSDFRAGWGDSLLQSIYDSCRNLDSTMANIAALVFDAKTDVIKIPELTENITNRQFEDALLTRFSAARMIKGNHGILMLDGDEEYDSKSYAFGGLDTIADRFMQVASGAADIPMTRLLGMSPAGMNSTGESDLLNYYDRIQSMQNTELQPEMLSLDRMIVRRAGHDPNSESFVWRTLRQLTEQQKAEARMQAAGSLEMISNTGIYSREDLAQVGRDLFADLDVILPETAGPPPVDPNQNSQETTDD